MIKSIYGSIQARVKFPGLLFLFVCTLLSGLDQGLLAQDDTRVINTWLKYSDAPNALNRYLTAEAVELLNARKEEVSRLNTVADWKQRQTQIKNSIWEVLGEFPEKTPLNAKTLNIVKKPGYTMENIVYESLPGFYVTASLFIPDKTQKKAPAILFCSGHSGIAYRRDVYQLPLLNLVKKGFVVLAIDPVGQGERLQYFDADEGVSKIGSSTKEHSYPAPQAALLGQSVARYFTWDGIRGIDYLVSRKEVDPDRIGVHGLSGGGTQTAYISAVDERVVASAPACYITNFTRLMESIGVQDGEQNFYHGIKKGIDHADFIEARVPKPTLVMATTADFFSIEGVYETMEELRPVYDIFGKSDNLEFVEDDHGHGYTQKTREAMYAFFQKHLALPGSPKEEQVELLTEEEFQKTPTGQLATSFGGETVFSLNHTESGEFIRKLENSRQDLKAHLSRVAEAAKRLSGYREPSGTDQAVFTGRIQKEGYAMEKYFIKGEGDYVVPYLLLVPENSNSKAIVYLHPHGKAGIMEDEEQLRQVLARGFTILVPDLIGTGELGNGTLKGDAFINNVSYNVWFSAMLVGRSIVGIQASDLNKLSRLLKEVKGMDEVYGVAREEMSPALLHAAAFDTAISRVALIDPYASYRSFVTNEYYNTDYVYSLVPGALTAYDLPDLAASLAPGKLLVAGVTDANSQLLGKADLDRDLGIIRSAYRSEDASPALQISPTSALTFSDFLKWAE